MVIYNDGHIYGVGWCIYDASGNIILGYEKRYPNIITRAQIQDIKNDYNALSRTQKLEINVYFLTKIKTSYSTQYNTSLSRWPGDISRLQELFDIGYTIL